MDEVLIRWIAFIFMLIFFIAIGFSVVSWTLYNGISPMPSAPKAKKCLLSLLPTILPGNICDLGSGFGTLIFLLAKKYPNSSIIGYETSLFPYLFTKFILKCFTFPNVKVLRQNFFHVDLGNFSLVVCYLYPDAMKNLSVKFEKELRPGTYIISNTFAIPNWRPEKFLEVNDLYHSKIYLYKIYFKEN